MDACKLLTCISGAHLLQPDTCHATYIFSNESCKGLKDTRIDCDHETALLTNVTGLAERWQALLQP